MSSNSAPTQSKPPIRRKQITLKSLAFHSHRWIGLTAGSLLCLAGITGSVLVFWKEIDRWLLAGQFKAIIPTVTTAPISTIIERLTATYTPKGLTLTSRLERKFRDYFKPQVLCPYKSTERAWPSCG